MLVLLFSCCCLLCRVSWVCVVFLAFACFGFVCVLFGLVCLLVVGFWLLLVWIDLVRWLFELLA